MAALAQIDVSTLRPLAGHLPLALCVLAALVVAVYAARGTAAWRRASLVALALGVAGAAWVSRMDWAPEPDGRPNPIAGGTVDAGAVAAHAQAVGWTLWAAVAALAAFAVAALWLRRLPAPTEVGKRDPGPLRFALLLAALVPAALAAYAVYLGGVVVWGRPVG